MPWEALVTGNSSAVAASPVGLLLVPPGELHVERIAWRELAGIRSRNGSSRFYRAATYVEVPVAGIEEQFRHLCQLHRDRAEADGVDPVPHQLPGVNSDDDDVIMTYSWEIEKARDAGLLQADETVLACAFGTGTGSIAPGVGPALDAPDPVDAAGVVLAPARDSHAPLMRTEVFLTNQRLLQVNRHRNTDELIAHFEVVLDHLPTVRRVGTVLTLGRLELRTESLPHTDLAADFMRRYGALVMEYFDPFAPEVLVELPEHPAEPVQAAGLPDPFAPELELDPGRPGAARAAGR